MDPDIQLADEWYQYLRETGNAQTHPAEAFYVTNQHKATPVRMQQCELDDSVSIRVIVDGDTHLPPYFKDRPQSSKSSGRPRPERPRTAMASLHSYEKFGNNNTPCPPEDSPRVTLPQHVINTFDAEEYLDAVQPHGRPVISLSFQEQDKSSHNSVSTLKGRKISVSSQNVQHKSHLRPKSAVPYLHSKFFNQTKSFIPRAPPTSPTHGRRSVNTRMNSSVPLTSEQQLLSKTQSPRSYAVAPNGLTSTVPHKRKNCYRPMSAAGNRYNLETWMSQIHLQSHRCSRPPTAHLHKPPLPPTQSSHCMRNRPGTCKLSGLRTMNAMWQGHLMDPEWLLQSFSVKHLPLHHKPNSLSRNINSRQDFHTAVGK